MEVVATASTGAEAIALFRKHRPDITLMDLELPDISGFTAIQAIKEEEPSARIVVLTMYRGDEDIHRALNAGAVTYLTKDSIVDELVTIVRQVHAGGHPIPDNVRRILANRKRQASLTVREIEVLALLAQGLRNKEIAAGLGLSEETAKVHVKNILSKLNVNDRTAAVTVALRRGLIHI
jgi:DNA-binding NarL/FixJ family response regulator